MNTWPTANDGVLRTLGELGEHERIVYEAVRDWNPSDPREPRSPSVLHLAHRFRSVMHAARLLEIMETLHDKHLLMPGDLFHTPTHAFSTYIAKVYDSIADDAATLRQQRPAPKAQQDFAEFNYNPNLDPLRF